MSDKEIWKNIVGYEGLYQVSSLGRVKSLERIDSNGHPVKERVLTSFPNRSGYCKVNLYRDRNMEVKSVHRLVAETFIPNPDNLPQVNHKDENKANNAVSNLEWCSALYNNLYNGRNKRVAKANEHPIYVVTNSGHHYFFGSVKKASELLGLNHSRVSKCLRGKAKHHHGYTFELAV
ncbi:NUMOD4 domain-containing protein [Lacticaseibacillus rhamnosus]|uniref:NUMOD4 domain-containing protein n=1 Tax=Lacticaseibacillus rhamnosus TaxID=47715 RepID=UPI000532B507|nr:NUMOD4 domain-containing protein [Lacticaseibacillus rhamnosus]